MGRTRLIAAILFTFALAACSASTTFTVDDDGGSVSLTVGEELTLILPGNPSTGYGWTVVAVDQAVLAQVDEPEFTAETDLIGAPGELRFRFEALAEGTTLLEMVYERVFEDGEPLGRFTLEIDVR